MITKFYFQRFKSYQDAALPMSPLTLLIGANASGKSNAIEGVRLLSWMAKGQRLSDILISNEKQDMLLRGISTDLGYFGDPVSQLGCEWERVGTQPWNRFSIEFEHSNAGMMVINEEITSSDGTVLYHVPKRPTPLSGDLEVAYNNFKRGRNKPRITCQNQQAVFTQLTTPARFGKNDADSQEIIPQTARTLREMLEQILFLDPNPSRMRDYSFIVNKTLQGDGANLSSVLYDLCENQGEKQAILAFIQALPEQDIRDVKFITTPRNEVMLQLTESFAQQERTWDAALLSDGTLRVLAIVAALLSAPKNAMVVIEEIDNGVHPSRARMLLENIQKIVRQRNLQVLLTTHNPALLDALPIAAVPDVVCCYRDPKQGDSRLIKLSDVRDYPELVSQGPVGTLMTRGVLDHYLKNPRSAAQKKKENLAWLENMKKSVEMK
jgi:predicted ATPase